MLFTQNINYYDKGGESFADIRIEDFVFHCRISGIDNIGDAVILLHGFPETSRMWYPLMEVLETNGMKVIAPDQRGYSHGARPPKISDYTIDKLSKDVIDIADGFQFDKFHLIGHDWGSAVGWNLVSANSERVISWTALSIPHLDAFFESLNTDKEQQRKSRYFSFFKKPILPELYFKIFGNKYLIDIWRKSSNLEKEKYLEVFKQRGAMKAALNWYRANINNDYKLIGDIYTPTLIL